MYIVMDKCDDDLYVLRRAQRHQRFSPVTTLRLAFQAVGCIHEFDHFLFVCS